jgi:hypothetical protein
MLPCPYQINQNMTHTQGIDLWEAWIDKQVIGAQLHNMLYVVGEVFADKKSSPRLIKKNTQDHPNQLQLQIVVPNTAGANIEEVYFSEVIQKDCPYKEIVVFSDNEIIAAIMDIETVEDVYA